MSIRSPRPSSPQPAHSILRFAPHRFTGRIAVVGIVSLVLAAPPALRADAALLLVGDSWARQAYDDGVFSSMLAGHGHPEIAVRGALTTEDGSTAAEWAQASYRQRITDELTAHPEIETVVIFAGGNDFLEGMSGGGWYVGISPGDEAALFEAIGSNVATLVDHVLGLDPDLEVVLSSYDYPNFVQSLSGLLSSQCQPLWTDLGEPTPLEINSATNLIDAQQAALAATRPRVRVVTHWGLMQKLFADPDLVVPPGDPALPSPVGAMRYYFGFLGPDCFHLRASGYAGIAERLWQFALSRQYDGLFFDGFESGDLSAWSSSAPAAP